MNGLSDPNIASVTSVYGPLKPILLISIIVKALVFLAKLFNPLNMHLIAFFEIIVPDDYEPANVNLTNFVNYSSKAVIKW